MFQLLTSIREKQPLVLNLANMVTPQHVADGINVIGASPLMIQEPMEAAEMVGISNAVVLNIGSLTEEKFRLYVAMGKAANAAGKPVILDPVAVGLPYRSEFVHRLMAEIKINIIRGNAAEIGWFTEASVAGRGIDALSHDIDVMIPRAAAQKTGAVIVQTGPVDVITDGKRTSFVKNESTLLAVNVGAGDMLSGLVGAFAGVTSDYYVAGFEAAVLMGVAGEQAAKKAQQLPGHFMGELFNQLYTLTDQDLEKLAKVEVID